MAIWSSLRPLLFGSIKTGQNAIQQRFMGGHERVIPFQTSRFQWNKFKDTFHLYLAVGIIPLGLIVFLSNVFVGPATLSEIPRDYVPKDWEYYRHPITRFFARYLMTSPQQEYEKYMHFVYEEDEKIRLRILERDILRKMAERNDYAAFYYRPVMSKYHRAIREAAEEADRRRGD